MLLGYCRVSSTEQAAEDKSSLETQEKIIRGYAMAKGFSQFDTAVYTDPGVSASIPLRKRPAGSRLLEDAKAGDTIIASKLDRMFRSASDALNMVEIFKEKDINLVLFDLGSEPINSSGLAQFFFTIIAAVAQLERTMIKERVMGGKKVKKAKGGHIGGKTPYGYRVVGHGRDARLEAVEKEQQVIATVKEWLAEQPYASIYSTTQMLTEQGLTARNGKPFFTMQVKRIMDQVQSVSH
ncbi:MAG: recombinase family protein [Hyphomicrobium sp.]|jgi:DNA invertase Pin-like site-specific DNA recombinase